MNSGVLIFYALSKLAIKNGTKVILTGVGGDELFGGYPWQSGHVRKIDKIFKFTYDKLPYSEFLSRLSIKLNRKLATAYQILFDYKVWHAECLSSFRYDFETNKKKIEKKIRANANKYFKLSHRHITYGDLYNIMSYANTFTVLGSQNYTADIAAMRYSVENRSPFLDYRLYEFLMSVPDEIKSKYGQKGFLRKILKKHLPNYVTNAKKSGPTMPINKWLYDNNTSQILKDFIIKHIKLIQEYLSNDIAKIIQSPGWITNKKNSLKLFAIISFIIWAKFNILQDIEDENITFEELIKS